MQWSGRRLLDRFRVIEHEARFDVDLTRALLGGDEEAPCVAYVVRNAVDRDHCERFAANFWDIIERRGSFRVNDGAVEVSQVGATQYSFASDEYLARSTRTRDDVDGLFHGLGDGGREQILREELFSSLLADTGLAFRPAGYRRSVVNPCAARSWKNTGAFSLEPHEDAAQLAIARRDGFEIGEARNVVSAVVVATDAHGGGELRMWDWAPDDEARAALALAETGYPYPAEITERFPSVEIATRAGDFVLLRGEFVHAVNPTSRPGRVSVSRFIGRIETGEVVYWT